MQITATHLCTQLFAQAMPVSYVYFFSHGHMELTRKLNPPYILEIGLLIFYVRLIFTFLMTAFILKTYLVYNFTILRSYSSEPYFNISKYFPLAKSDKSTLPGEKVDIAVEYSCTKTPFVL